MAKYVFKYWFEWGGTCLGSDNAASKEKYDYAVDEQKLPISRKLKDFLQYLQAYHDTMVDMDNAPEDSPWWTEEDTIMFNKKEKVRIRPTLHRTWREIQNSLLLWRMVITSYTNP